MSYSKQEIVQNIKNRKDREVLDWMYKTIYPKVNKYIMSHNGSSEDSKDIFQEAVLTFYNLVVDDKVDKIDDVQAFLMVVSRNKWINKAKKQQREVKYEEIENEPDLQNSPLITMIMNEKWKAFQHVFDQLGEKCKELLTFSVYEKCSMEEIVVKMGFLNADAAKTANYRCKQKMIKYVGANKALANALRG